jgi:hypothetical protein
VPVFFAKHPEDAFLAAFSKPSSDYAYIQFSSQAYKWDRIFLGVSILGSELLHFSSIKLHYLSFYKI